GHRRLAIVGVDARGAQPMTDGDLTVVCNGEIYNYPDLRRRLECDGRRFRSDCDTEVLLHAHALWGLDFLEELNGIYAFALYDAAKKQLLLVRDRAGVKPLAFAALDAGGLAFASEPKALLLHPRIARRPNLDAIRGDLVHALCGPKHATWFAGIDNLEPGCV